MHKVPEVGVSLGVLPAHVEQCLVEVHHPPPLAGQAPRHGVLVIWNSCSEVLVHIAENYDGSVPPSLGPTASTCHLNLVVRLLTTESIELVL